MLFKEFKDVFAWTYKDLKGIPPEVTQHIIELNTSKPATHQTRYRLNPNYATTIKKNIEKLLLAQFIQVVEEATWLSLIVVVPKKNGKLKFCVDFKKLNKATKTNPYPLPFSNEVLNTIVGYEVFFF
jgi:predicted transcriptional regulator